MIQDREERKEERRLKEEAVGETRREGRNRREERAEDWRNTERMFAMAVGGIASYFSGSNKRNVSQISVPTENDLYTDEVDEVDDVEENDAQDISADWNDFFVIRS